MTTSNQNQAVSNAHAKPPDPRQRAGYEKHFGPADHTAMHDHPAPAARWGDRKAWMRQDSGVQNRSDWWFLNWPARKKAVAIAAAAGALFALSVDF